jgi:PIN domain nuclease of toxin-antitoxin system
MRSAQWVRHGPRRREALPYRRREHFLDRPGIEAVPPGHRVACRCYAQHHFPHRDPADRPLIATAIELGCPLITYNERIVAFGEGRRRASGFAAAA